jgi:hypothetical protein
MPASSGRGMGNEKKAEFVKIPYKIEQVGTEKIK